MEKSLPKNLKYFGVMNMKTTADVLSEINDKAHSNFPLGVVHILLLLNQPRGGSKCLRLIGGGGGCYSLE